MPADDTTLRVASYNVELQGRGPGLMLRDLMRAQGRGPAVARIIAGARADVLLLQGVDYDHDLHGARALRDLISEAGWIYPHLFARRPNSGMASGLDLDGDGRLATARDAQGFGDFAGQRGMVVMSRWPILETQVQDFSALLWRDLPGADLPVIEGRPFPSEAAQAVQRLSSTGHWIVPIQPPGQQRITLMGFAATPPVFDGPEDRNGRRNADEIRLWSHVLDGRLGHAPRSRFFVLGDANLDPDRGAGRHEAIRALLADPRLQDPLPRGPDGSDVTVDWPDPLPGDMRVDYVLPSADWTLRDAGVFWPETAPPEHGGQKSSAMPASRHRLVWVDVTAGNEAADP